MMKISGFCAQLSCCCCVMQQPGLVSFAGFDPMQKINAVMGLGWLQTYVDIPMLFTPERYGHINPPIPGKGIDMPMINNGIAEAVAGALWPLDANEAPGCQSRMTDLVSFIL